MIRKLLTVLLLVVAATFVHAQVALSASDVADAFTHPIAAGKLCFAPVDATGTPTGFRVGSTQVVSTPVCGVVSNGVLQSGLTVEPTPTGIYYHITAVTYNTGNTIRDYGMTQVTGSAWSLDTYDPSLAIIPVSAITMGTVTVVPGTDGASCTIGGEGPYVLNCSIPTVGTPGPPGPTFTGGTITTPVTEPDYTNAGPGSTSSESATINNLHNAAPVPITEYGAVGDYSSAALTGCTIGAGSNLLNCTGRQAALSMVGKWAVIPLAGVVTNGVASAVASQIATFVNSGQITLSTAATTAVTTAENVGVGSDNYSAEQNTINHCYTLGCTVIYPNNATSTTSQTVYWHSKTVDPEGVSLIQPVGSQGDINTPYTVAVRGAPGIDVFAVGDPASVGWVSPKSHFEFHLAVITDDRYDPSCGTGTCQAFVANRWPGRFAVDGIVTNTGTGGVAVVTSATAFFQPGDATGQVTTGQNIAVWGSAGNPAGTQACPDGSGNNCLLTTIQTFNSQTQVTLPVPALNPESAVKLYISVQNLPVNQTIGNVGLAYDNSTSATAEAVQGADFSDSNFLTASGTSHTNAVGSLLFQGDSLVYHSIFTHMAVEGAHGFLFICSNQPVTGAHNCGWNGPDIFNHLYFASNYPWLSYQGAQFVIDDWQLSDVIQGPNILAATGITGLPTTGRIDVPEEEEYAGDGDACLPGWTAYRINGTGLVVGHLYTPHCDSGSMLFQYDATGSPIQDVYLASLNPVDIGGSYDAINSTQYGNYNIQWSNTGVGNSWKTCRSTSPVSSVEPGVCSMGAPGSSSSPTGPITLARTIPALQSTSAFISEGASNYFRNLEDLYMRPDDIADFTTPSLPWVFDSTSNSGEAFSLPASSTPNYYMIYEQSTPMIIGTQIPAGQNRIYFSAEATAAQNLYADATYGTSGTPTTSLGCSFIGTPMALTTSYTTQSCDINIAASKIGDRFGIRLGNGSASLANGVSLGWVAIRPWDSDGLFTGITIGAGSKQMVSSSGTGGIAQETTAAAKTNGDLAWYQNGNVDDSGIPSSFISSTPSINGGDLICAHGGDQTIRATSITGGSGTGSAYTLSAASLSPPMYVPGQKIGVIGSGVSGLDGGPYTVTAFTTTSVTFATTATGTPTGGTFYLWCENSTDATAAFTSGSAYFQYNPLPLSAFVAGKPQTHTAVMSYYTTASAPAVHTTATIATGSSPGFSLNLYTSGALTPAASLTGQSGQLSVTALPLAVGSTGPLEVSQVFQGPFTTTSAQSTLGALQSINTSSVWNSWVSVYFATTGLGSITSGSGGTITGQTTCTLATFNDSDTGATATVNFPTAGSWTGATFVVTNTGYGATAAPTSATLGGGCSGTATLVTVLGGAQGNAVGLISIQ